VSHSALNGFVCPSVCLPVSAYSLSCAGADVHCNYVSGIITHISANADGPLDVASLSHTK